MCCLRKGGGVLLALHVALVVVSPHKDNTLLLTAVPKTISFCFSFANVDVLRVLFSDTAATCVGDFEQVWGGGGQPGDIRVAYKGI